MTDKVCACWWANIFQLYGYAHDRIEEASLIHVGVEWGHVTNHGVGSGVTSGSDVKNMNHCKRLYGKDASGDTLQSEAIIVNDVSMYCLVFQIDDKPKLRLGFRRQSRNKKHSHEGRVQVEENEFDSAIYSFVHHRNHPVCSLESFFSRLIVCEAMRNAKVAWGLYTAAMYPSWALLDT